jgi:hypothetical protein
VFGVAWPPLVWDFNSARVSLDSVQRFHDLVVFGASFLLHEFRSDGGGQE